MKRREVTPDTTAEEREEIAALHFRARCNLAKSGSQSWREAVEGLEAAQDLDTAKHWYRYGHHITDEQAGRAT